MLTDDEFDIIEPLLHPDLLPSGSIEPYQPSLIKRENLTCNTPPIFKLLTKVNEKWKMMNWVVQPENKGLLVIGHCRGCFDFHFLVDMTVQVCF